MRVLRTCAVLSLFAVSATPAAQRAPSPDDNGVHMVPVEGEGAKYWPRWRGPSGQGIGAGGGYVDAWSSTENVRWKAPVSGLGNSSPIVWADRLFLTTAYDRGAKLSVLAFRRSDGARLWETFVPAHGGYAHQKNGHASATAATDGVRVYASFGSALAAVDLTGKLVWTADLGPISNYHGPAGSPLLHRDRLILFQDQGRD